MYRPVFKINSRKPIDETNDHNHSFGFHTIDLVIFACLNFRKFPIFLLFTKFRIRDFSFFFSKAIIIIIFEKFLNLRICPPREIRENYYLANIARCTVIENRGEYNDVTV